MDRLDSKIDHLGIGQDQLRTELRTGKDQLRTGQGTREELVQKLLSKKGGRRRCLYFRLRHIPLMFRSFLHHIPSDTKVFVQSFFSVFIIVYICTKVNESSKSPLEG